MGREATKISRRRKLDIKKGGIYLARNRLRDVAKKKKYEVEYDQPTNRVSVRNPSAGTSINFQSGQGQQYGMGGLREDYNVVSDINKLSSMLDAPKNPSSLIPGATSGKVANLSGKLGSAVDRYNERYDPTTDPVFQNLSKHTTSQMLQDFGSRGLGGADFAQGAMSKANLQLGLQFKQRDQANKAQDINNILTQIQNARTNEIQNYNRTVQQSKDIADQFGVYIPPDQLQQMTQEQRTMTQPYADDYQAAINLFGPQSAFGKVLTQARYQKLAANPENYEQFFEQTIPGQQAQNKIYGSYLGNVSKELNNAIESARAVHATDLANIELDILQNQLETGQLNANAKRIANKYLDEKMAAEINRIQQAAATSAVNRKAKQAQLDEDNAKPKALTTAEKNSLMGKHIKAISALSANEAINELVTYRAEYTDVYGPAGYKQLWDSALAGFIREGQAQKYSNYFKNPNTSTGSGNKSAADLAYEKITGRK